MMNKLLLLLIFSFSSLALLAHQDFRIYREFGNIKLRMETGFEYEEINKIFIIVEYAKKLCKKLNYTKPIFLEFDHSYVRDIESDYFMSYEVEGLQFDWQRDMKKNFTKKKAIIIRQYAKQFDIKSTLQLIEFGIKNEQFIESIQKNLKYTKNYHQLYFNTIDTNRIKKELERNDNRTIEECLQSKVYRSEANDKSESGSYFYSNCEFSFFFKDKKDKVILQLDQFYEFHSNSDYMLVFDTDSSFYFISNDIKPRVSERNQIYNMKHVYRPFKVSHIYDNNLSIRFTGFMDGQREVLYNIDTGNLREDSTKWRAHQKRMEDMIRSWEEREKSQIKK